MTKVLVIDDEPMIARSIGRSLHSHDVTVVSDALDALELLRSHDFEVVVCDVVMPRLDGPSLYQTIVKERDCYAGRFVFMSGGAHGGPALEYLQEHKLPLLPKPFTPAELASACARLGAADLAPKST